MDASPALVVRCDCRVSALKRETEPRVLGCLLLVCTPIVVFFWRLSRPFWKPKFSRERIGKPSDARDGFGHCDCWAADRRVRFDHPHTRQPPAVTVRGGRPYCRGGLGNRAGAVVLSSIQTRNGFSPAPTSNSPHNHHCRDYCQLAHLRGHRGGHLETFAPI